MITFLRKHRTHVFIWTAMLVYLAAAPSLHERFVLQGGKPLPMNVELPKTTTLIRSSVEGLSPVVVNGENLYKLKGWAFLRGKIDQSAYDRLIVLQSGRQTYYFPTRTYASAEFRQAFPHPNIDPAKAGFSISIARDAILRGAYQIGILFKQKSGGQVYYAVTLSQLIRGGNHMWLTR